MFGNLKKHPFAVTAFFESSLVLTFAVPKEELQCLIPACLELDTLNERFAFIAAAMVQTRYLRPKGLPRVFGNDFFLIGYRVFVRYTSNGGKQLRGLYILKSETNKKKMEWFGNIFTRYQYTTTDINISTDVSGKTIASLKSGFNVKLGLKHANVMLPAASPFTDWKEARKFAGPLPFTFSYDDDTREVLIVEGVRTNWQPAPIQVLHYHFSWLKSLQLKQLVLANAFEIKHVPYYWKKGRTEIWKG